MTKQGLPAIPTANNDGAGSQKFKSIKRQNTRDVLNRANLLRKGKCDKDGDSEEDETKKSPSRRGTGHTKVSFDNTTESSEYRDGGDEDGHLPAIRNSVLVESPELVSEASFSSRALSSSACPGLDLSPAQRPFELPAIPTLRHLQPGSPSPEKLEWNGEIGDFVDQLTPHLEVESCLAKAPKDVICFMDELGPADCFFLGGFLQGELVARRPDLQRRSSKLYATADARKIGLELVIEKLQDRAVSSSGTSRRRHPLDEKVAMARAMHNQEKHPRREAVRLAKMKTSSSLNSFHDQNDSAGLDDSFEGDEASEFNSSRHDDSARKSVRINEDFHCEMDGAASSSSPAYSVISKRQKERNAVQSQTEQEAAKMFLNRQREACESLRILVFGEVGNEHWKTTDRTRIFEQSRGTYDEVRSFVRLWSQIDEDSSDDIDFGEFLEFFAKSKADRLLCMRCVRYLLGRQTKEKTSNTGCDQVFNPRMSRKSSTAKCTREDMMRLIWLKATDHDINLMNQMFDLHKLQEMRVQTPPLLAKKKRKQLLENFRFLDKESRGVIAYTDLVEGGLVDEELMKALQVKYDHQSSGYLHEDDFLEMLCPYGCRAHERVRRMISKDDKLIQLVTCDVRHLQCGFDSFAGWLLDNDVQEIRNMTQLPLQVP